MNDYQFTKEQITMLFNGISHEQIMNNVFRYVFQDVGNVKIDHLIERCMKIYADICIDHFRHQAD